MVGGLALALLLSITVFATAAPATSAVTPAPTIQQKNRGLYISPLRSYLTLTPGQTVTRAFTVANLTDQPITVRLSVEKFSVADYSYNYTFTTTDNDRVRVLEPQVELEPYKSRRITYRVSVPANGLIGGQYYSLLATSNLSPAGLAGTARVASLLYLTVDGPLTRTSQIISSSLPRIVISPEISYHLSVKNTGNVHYFANFTAAVDGLFYHNEPTGVSRLLMPGSPRTIENSVASPLLPGIYRLTYSYAPDQGNKLGGSQYFIFLPPWSWAAGLILAYLAYKLIRKRLNKKKLSAHQSNQ